MTPSIFIGLNYFGAGNFGDDLMLDGFLRRLECSAKGATVVGSTPHDIQSQRKRFPSIRWLTDREGERAAAIGSADVWLGLGCTPFQLESGPYLLDALECDRELCRRFGKPMVFLGSGCESPDSVRDPRARRVIADAERIWTRDARSAELISAVATAAIVVAGGDLAHVSLADCAKCELEVGAFGLLLGLEHAGIVDMLAVDRFLARPSAPATRWLLQEGRCFAATERWNYAALSEWVQAKVALMPLDYGSDTIDEFLATFGAPEVVLSSRYHGSLIAAWRGSRVGIIARNEKLDGAVADLGVPFVRRIETAGDLEALAQDAVPVAPARLRSLRDRASAMCDSFFAWLGAEPRVHAAGAS